MTKADIKGLYAITPELTDTEALLDKVKAALTGGAHLVQYRSKSEDIALLTEARQRLRVPIVAIGGITPANAGALVAAGADAVAVITALFDAPDITATAAHFDSLFQTKH